MGEFNVAEIGDGGNVGADGSTPLARHWHVQRHHMRTRTRTHARWSCTRQPGSHCRRRISDYVNKSILRPDADWLNFPALFQTGDKSPRTINHPVRYGNTAPVPTLQYASAIAQGDEDLDVEAVVGGDGVLAIGGDAVEAETTLVVRSGGVLTIDDVVAKVETMDVDVSVVRT